MSDKIKCPYCGETFSEDYYDKWHVPCPEKNRTEVGRAVPTPKRKMREHYCWKC